jgi:NitT/TauT family transport system permease protein
VAAGVRLAFSLTFIGVVLGEMSASRAGLGFLLNAADAMFDSNRVLAVIFVLGVIGFGVHYAFYLVERALSPARPEVRQTLVL